MASSDEGGLIKLWDVAHGFSSLNLSGHRERVLGLAFSTDGQRLLSIGGDQTIKIWDPEAGRAVAQIASNRRLASAAVFSPDGRFAYVATADQAFSRE